MVIVDNFEILIVIFLYLFTFGLLLWSLLVKKHYFIEFDILLYVFLLIAMFGTIMHMGEDYNAIISSLYLLFIVAFFIGYNFFSSGQLGGRRLDSFPALPRLRG